MTLMDVYNKITKYNPDVLVCDAFLTGTTYWKIAGENSDIDVVINDKFYAENVKIEPEAQKIEPPTDAEGYAVGELYKIGNFHFIILDEKNFNLWYGATWRIANLIYKRHKWGEVLKDKELRIDLFRLFCNESI